MMAVGLTMTMTSIFYIDYTGWLFIAYALYNNDNVLPHQRSVYAYIIYIYTYLSESKYILYIRLYVYTLLIFIYIHRYTHNDFIYSWPATVVFQDNASSWGPGFQQPAPGQEQREPRRCRAPGGLGKKTRRMFWMHSSPQSRMYIYIYICMANKGLQ